MKKGRYPSPVRALIPTGWATDIVSRSAQLEGEIAGKADIKVLAGQNDYDLATRSHTVRNKGDGRGPAVAIDGSALGSMYGGKIQLISTESGAGVRHAGGIIASSDTDISADGDITLASLSSEKTCRSPARISP